MYTSTLGLSQGEFTELKVLQNDTMTNILDIIGGGGSGTVVETASYPLVFTGSNIGINTSLFLPTSSECGKIGAAGCNHGANDFKAQSVTLTSPDASQHALTADDTGRLIVAGARPLLANSITVGAGLFALASNANGFLSLALTGAESRTTLRLQDSAAVVRELTSSNTGQLTWDGTAIETLAGLAVVSPISLVTNAFTAAWLDLWG